MYIEPSPLDPRERLFHYIDFWDFPDGENPLPYICQTDPYYNDVYKCIEWVYYDFVERTIAPSASVYSSAVLRKTTTYWRDYARHPRSPSFEDNVNFWRKCVVRVAKRCQKLNSVPPPEIINKLNITEFIKPECFEKPGLPTFYQRVKMVTSECLDWLRKEDLRQRSRIYGQEKAGSTLAAQAREVWSKARADKARALKALNAYHDPIISAAKAAWQALRPKTAPDASNCGLATPTLPAAQKPHTGDSEPFNGHSGPPASQLETCNAFPALANPVSTVVIPAVPELPAIGPDAN